MNNVEEPGVVIDRQWFADQWAETRRLYFLPITTVVAGTRKLGSLLARHKPKETVAKTYEHL